MKVIQLTVDSWTNGSILYALTDEGKIYKQSDGHEWELVPGPLEIHSINNGETP